MKKILMALVLSSALMIGGCAVSEQLATVNAATSTTYVVKNYVDVKRTLNAVEWTEEEAEQLKRFEEVLDTLYVHAVSFKNQENLAEVTLSAVEVLEIYTFSRDAYIAASKIILPKISAVEDPFIKNEIRKFHEHAVQLDRSIELLLEKQGSKWEVGEDAMQLLATTIELILLVK